VDHPLTTAFLRLNRAKEHIDEFERIFAARVEAHAYEPIHQMNLGTGEYWIHFEPPTFPRYYGLLLATSRTAPAPRLTPSSGRSSWLIEPGVSRRIPTRSPFPSAMRPHDSRIGRFTAS
jgi:hypothetical protein